MSRAWMPLYWGDYLRDTRDLTTLQHGAYLLLIAHYWQHDGLPGDERQLAAIAGLPLTTWRRIAPAIAAKFGDGWRHKRIDAEITRCERSVMQRRVAGAKGGQRAAVARAIAVGAALKTATQRPGLRQAASAVASGAAAAAASAPASGAATSWQPDSIHNHNHNPLPLSSSESEAAQPRGDETMPRPKRPHELTRAEIDAIHDRRRGGTPASKSEDLSGDVP